jgi:Tol biopolymer transport system component/DNA-binding winged helix-turn-helix (wHTH) protein
VDCDERVKSLVCQELAAEVNYRVHPLLPDSGLYCMAQEVERQVATACPLPLCARFEQFHVDLTGGILQRSGIRVPVQNQPLQVLRLLLQAEGKVVTREELRRVLWPEDTFVDFELGVNTAVKKLRQALTDPAEHPKFIETLPRIGYRFMIPVEWAADKSDNYSPPIVDGFYTPSDFEAAADLRRDKPVPLARLAKWSLLGVAVALLVLVAGVRIWRLSRDRSETSMPSSEMVPLVALSGIESSPAFSPDGSQVAFALEGPKNSGIYTTVVGGEKSLRLTSLSGDCCPRWSRDAQYLAFSRSSDDGVAIYSIPALGGTLHRLYSQPTGEHQNASVPRWRSGGRSFDWSPDGKFLAFSENEWDQTHAWIALLSLADYTTRRLTSPSSQYLDYGPAFSPDGSTVAFIRGITSGVVQDLYVVPAAGGAPKQLTFDNTWIAGPPAWTPDGREIVFSSRRGGLFRLWRISASGGTPRPVAGVGAIAVFPSISPKGDQLVYQQVYSPESNIWQLNLTNEKHRQGPPAIAISEKGNKFRPNISPDGKRIAFESNRLGYPEIWECDSNGTNCEQLTSLHGTAGAARWSPDGHNIAFEFRPKEHSEVYLLEVGGGVPRLLPTVPGADNGGPNWSRDGKWIYFYSDRGGGPFQLWKIQINGGPPVQITRNGGIFAAESSDGSTLYFSKFEAPGIWKMPLNGGEELRVLDQPAGEDWWNWALVQNGIYFFDSNSAPNAALKFFEFASGKTFPIFNSDNSGAGGLTVSPNGRSILYVQRDLGESSIMLVKNFR